MVRNERGQFVKGHERIGGRKTRATEARYLEIMKECVTDADWKQIVGRAKVDAKDGDSQARKFLVEYLVGAPRQSGEFTLLNLDDWFGGGTDDDSEESSNGK